MTKKIILTGCFIAACICIASISMSQEKNVPHYDNLNDCQFKDSNPDNPWKRDSCGCLHMRTYEMAWQMVEDNNLLNCSIKEFVYHFGSPNFIQTSNTRKFLSYYLDSPCTNANKLIAGSRCWITFEFKNDTLTEFPKVVSIE